MNRSYWFIFCFLLLSIELRGQSVETNISTEELVEYAKQFNLTVSKPTRVTCKIIIRCGITRSVEDAIARGPTINVHTYKVRWIVRDKNELYESIPVTSNQFSGVIEEHSPVSNGKLHGTFLTNGDYAMDYPSHIYEIPHGQVSRIEKFLAATEPITMLVYLESRNFINMALDVKLQELMKKNMDVDSLRLKIQKIDNRELIIQPVMLKNGIEYKKYTYSSSYDLEKGVIPKKYEVLYEGQFYRGVYVTDTLSYSTGKFFVKRLLNINKYDPSDTDDEESFKKMLADGRLVVSEFIVDSIDFDRIPADKDFEVTVPPAVSLFANNDSHRDISLLEGKNVVGLHNLKHLADRAELQYQLQQKKDANITTVVERSHWSFYRVICFVVGIVMLGLMIYLSVKRSKNINKGE
jgi:hypothetical protein